MPVKTGIQKVASWPLVEAFPGCYETTPSKPGLEGVERSEGGSREDIEGPGGINTSPLRPLFSHSSPLFSRLFSLLFPLFSLFVACAETQDVPLTPSEPAPSASALAEGKRTAVLLALAQATHAALFDTLGAHRLNLTIETRADTEEGTPFSFSESARFAASSNGDWQLERENSKGSGFDLYQVEDIPYLANRYAPLHPARLSEIQRLREETFGLLSENFALCAHLLRFSPKGREEIFGRGGLLFEVSPAKDPSPAPLAGSLPAEKQWRASIELAEAKGELLLDEETFLPLRASLSLRFRAKKEGVFVSFFVSLTQTISDVGAKDLAITLPEVAPLPPPYRLSVEREALLGKAALRPEARSEEPTQSTPKTSKSQPAKAPKTRPAKGQPVKSQPQSSPER